MNLRRRIASVAAAGFMGTALAVVAPSVANAADPCMLGWSNVGPRSCESHEVSMFPALTLGNGPCVGVLVASGNSFDGPLYEYSNRPGATHGVELRISQGISPLGEWAPTLLACDVTAIIDWHNHDTGQSGTVHQHIPARNNSTSPVTTVFETGRGNVSLTVRTDHPNLPASANVFVP